MEASREDGTKVMDTLREFSEVGTVDVIGVEQFNTSTDAADKEPNGLEIVGEVS